MAGSGQPDKDDISRHPALLAFDGLLGLRAYAKANPADMPGRFVNYCATQWARSHSQLFQDLFAVFCLSGKRNGYFVEFGATDGVDLSNTLLLERELGWTGILAEPAKCWHAALKKNRRALIDTRCVWSRSGESLAFKETALPVVSTLAEFVDRDFNRHERVQGLTYPVETISLNDLLKTHSSPKEIDYLSIDTEGSELSILQGFAFGEYDVKVITVEHNFCEPDRTQINELLAAQDFVRVFTPLSKFDDWYVKRSIINAPR